MPAPMMTVRNLASVAASDWSASARSSGRGRRGSFPRGSSEDIRRALRRRRPPTAFRAIAPAAVQPAAERRRWRGRAAPPSCVPARAAGCPPAPIAGSSMARGCAVRPPRAIVFRRSECTSTISSEKTSSRNSPRSRISASSRARRCLPSGTNRYRSQRLASSYVPRSSSKGASVERAAVFASHARLAETRTGHSARAGDTTGNSRTSSPSRMK